MTLEEIFKEWSKDSVINQLDLGGAALDIPKLHNKYLQYYSAERKALRKLEAQKKRLEALKYDYFNGVLNGTDQLDKLGWEPMLRTMLKADIPRHVEADADMQKIDIMIGDQKEITETLASILKEIMSRNFVIKSAIDWRKFTEGVN